MIIIHEKLVEEAERIAKRVREIYGFNSRIMNKDLTPVFVEIPEFNGFWYSPCQLMESLAEYNSKQVLVVTPRDLYINKESKDDAWIFGCCLENLILVSTARMKRFDNKSSTKLIIPKEQYMKRLELLAVHEIGHRVVKAPHFQAAVWVNNQTGYKLEMGFHCTDNTCAMYEIVDIRAPTREEGYMQLGTEKKYDAGLDDVIERLNPKWFCDKCKSSIKTNGS